MVKNKSLERETFSAKLMAALLNSQMNENVVISPMGISYILKVLQCGMKPDSVWFKKIEELIYNESHEKQNPFHEKSALSHALSCWHNNKYGTLKDEFIKGLSNFKDVSVFEMDFEQDIEIAEKMNNWVKKNTHGFIRKIGMDINPNAIMSLMDTLCLYAKWLRTFDKNNTKRSVFYNANGSKSKVDMMHRVLYFYHYSETNKYQTITLRYEKCFEEMKIVKPKGNTSLFKLMTEEFDLWTKSNEELAHIDFYMPRFKIESKLDLTSIFERMGLSEMLHSTDVFSEMAYTPIILDKIQEHCVMKVDEKGTKAASSIESCMKFGTPPQVKSYKMKLDKPFGFAIMGMDRVPLFTGVVNTLPDLH